MQQSQQDGSRSGSRRRQDSEAGSRRGGSSTSTGSTLHVVNGNEGDAPPPSIATASSRRATRKETRFGEYILGQTLGEGEFGKVKLGWRRDGGVQVSSMFFIGWDGF
jgi:protein-serine/threonine kinase